MTVRYEANPPKITLENHTEYAMSNFVKKIEKVSVICDAVHLTENVLGFQRVSPIDMGRMIKDKMPNLTITASMRVRDKTELQIQEFVDGCIDVGFSGILVLMGDSARDGRQDSGEIPSAVVKRLHNQGIDSKIDLYLSIPRNPDFKKIQKKIDASPKGFITQVIQSQEQVQNLHDGLAGFVVIPIILFPSEKNTRSAEFLNINMAQYAKDFTEFTNSIHSTTGDILITSPNDFQKLEKFLKDRHR